MRSAFVAGLAALLALAGCRDTPAPAAETGHPALWEVRNGKGKLEGWLFGTIHALPPGVTWQTPAIDDAIERSRLLVMEVADPGAGGPVFRRLATTPDQPPLESKLPAGLRDDLADIRADVDLPESLFDDLETWAAAIYIANSTSQGARSNGIENILLDEFDGRPVAELEGTERQLSLFDTLPEDQQRTMLAAVVREAADPNRDLGRERRAWLGGDLTAIERDTRRSFLADPELRETLLSGRNRAWADDLQKRFPQWGPAFVAVGAGHMAGEDGLPALLAAKGYAVTRVE